MRYYIVGQDDHILTTDDEDVAKSHSMDDDLIVIDTQENAVMYEGDTSDEPIEEAQYLQSHGSEIGEDEI